MYFKRLIFFMLLCTFTSIASSAKYKELVTKELEEFNKGKVSKVTIVMQYSNKKNITFTMDAETFVECVIAATTNEDDFCV